MEKIGLLNELFSTISDNWETFSLKETSDAAFEYQTSLDATLKVLKKICKTGDVSIILTTEKMILKNDMEYYANSPEMKSSLKTGLVDLEIAQKAVEIVQDHNLYQTVKETMSRKDMAQGLPLDGFRKFERSHQTRLGNLLKTSLLSQEKSLILQRKINLKRARENYISMQRKALG